MWLNYLDLLTPPPLEHPAPTPPSQGRCARPGVQLKEAGEGQLEILRLLESFSLPPLEATLSLSH